MGKNVENNGTEALNYRQISLSSLNVTVNLTSTHQGESIDFLMERALFLMEQVKKDNNGG